jgi:hypothetical protein
MQAREYLARVIAWPSEGEQTTAYCNVHWTFVPKNHDPLKKLPWTGRACRTLDEAISALTFAQKGADTRDIYVCMSTQSQAVEKVSAKGFKYHVPVRFAENAVALKSLFIDLDAKGRDRNSYADLDEAVTALGKWLTDAALPPPSIVNKSGSGLHCYWTMSRALRPDEWRPLAHALREAGERHGLRFDGGCTTDMARVLRIPETKNWKTNPPLSVRIAAKKDFDYDPAFIAKALEPYKVVVPELNGHAVAYKFEQPPDGPSPFAGEPHEELAAGVETGMGQEEIRLCLDAIPNTRTDWIWWNNIGLRVFAASDGADYGREEWERWSARNAVAKPSDSVDDRWRTFHTSPPTRTGAGALIVEARDALKDPHWMPRVALPIQVTPQAAAQAVAAPHPFSIVQHDLPLHYTRRHNGLVCELVVMDDTTIQHIPVCDYPLVEPWLQREPSVLHFVSTVERTQHAAIDLPTELVGTTDMRRHLQAQGVMIPVGSGGADRVARFLMAWIKKLQDTRDSVASSPFGWSVKHGKEEGFVFGGQLWTPIGNRPAASADLVTMRHYTPAGELKAWIDAAKLITDQHRPDIEAIVASAFAAPLVRFTGQPGVLMSTYSTESGIGKTTAMKVGQAVWGDPVKGTMSLSDTHNAVMHKVGELKSLPLYWDEIKTADQTKKFVDITFQVTQGKERARLSRAITQREPGSWQTLLISASNDSLLDYVLSNTSTTTAGLYRIFEYPVQPAGSLGQVDPSEAARLVARLHDNYGNVGLEFAKFLGANVVRVEQEFADMLKALGQEVKATPDERFWIALIACIVTGARYANELGFAAFNTDELKAFMLRGLAAMRQHRLTQPVDMSRDINVALIIVEFLNGARARHTLFTNRIHVSKGKPAKNAIKVVRGDINKLEAVHVHVGLDDKLVRVSSAALGAWLKERGQGRYMVVELMIEKLGAVKVVGRLGGGTPYAQGTEYLLQFDRTSSAHLDFIDDV